MADDNEDLKREIEEGLAKTGWDPSVVSTQMLSRSKDYLGDFLRGRKRTMGHAELIRFRKLVENEIARMPPLPPSPTTLPSAEAGSPPQPTLTPEEVLRRVARELNRSNLVVDEATILKAVQGAFELLAERGRLTSDRMGLVVLELLKGASGDQALRSSEGNPPVGPQSPNPQ